MANPKWPSVIKCPLLENATYTYQENVIRSEFAGASKSRRRFTLAYTDVTFRLMLTSRAQMQILNDFCIYTCSDVMPFDWVEFRDPSHRPATYAFKQRPVFTPAGGHMWYADLQLELRTPFNGQFYIANGLRSIIETDDNEALTT